MHLDERIWIWLDWLGQIKGYGRLGRKKDLLPPSIAAVYYTKSENSDSFGIHNLKK